MANEKRLIWDEDAKRHLIALAVGHHSEMLHIDMILNAILHHTTTVDAVPVVHGRWIEGGKTMVDDVKGCILHCSECGDYCYNFEPIPPHNYCPNCGASMRERSEGE